MGFNNHGAMKVVIDLETVPLPEAADYIDVSDISAPSNWKDPEKIARYCEEEKAKRIDKAALDLDLCRIVALGWLEQDSQLDPVVMTANEHTEAHMLACFWQTLDDRATVGFNQVGFDLPILSRRSLYLGVPAPMLNLDKYRTNHIDLQQRLSFNGTKTFRSLAFYLKRFGIDAGDDSTSGKDIQAFVEAGNWAAVAHHCKCDVLHTKALAERIGLLKSQPLMSEAAF